MEKKENPFLIIACIFGMTAVIFGAFGAHGFKNMLLDNQIDMGRIDIYNKAVQYQFYHTFALFISILIPNANTKIKKFSSWFFIIGILFFSGSLYLLAIRDFISIPLTIVGPLTPIGGMFFIMGWSSLLLAIIKR